jgi:hypothetical protein
MNTVPRIQVFKANEGWMATFVDDDVMMSAFGTDTIPTAFTSQAKAYDVIKCLQERNPDHIVEMKPAC